MQALWLVAPHQAGGAALMTCENCGEAPATTTLPVGRTEAGSFNRSPKPVCQACFRWLDPNMSDADRLRRRNELDAFEDALSDRLDSACDALDRALNDEQER